MLHKTEFVKLMLINFVFITEHIQLSTSKYLTV